MKNLILLGASGNIGTQTIDVVRQHPTEFTIEAMSVGERTEALRDYLRTSPLKYACVKNKTIAEQFQKEYPATRFFHGDQGLIEITSIEEGNWVVNALQGFVGLLPTINAIRHKKNVCLANKETLVAAGEIVNRELRENKVELIPIDSEHSAIFQCLMGNRKKDVNKLIITASGGSFRNLKREELKNVTLAQALSHPNWNMGKKITIDSATMMNKGFEVTEAHWLFDIDYDRIETVIHRESIVHSLVEFNDHTVMAQLGVSDMRIPIQFALTYPKRYPNTSEALDLVKVGTLHFEMMNYERFPLLKLAYDTGKAGGNLSAVMNGANEQAVRLFLNEKIAFTAIEELRFETVSRAEYISNPTVEQIIESDRWAQEKVRQLARI